MKRTFNIVGLIALMLIIGFMFASTPARAEDKVITFKPTSVTVAKDRNGSDYVRMIWGDTKELNGIKYSSGSTVNAYRENLEAAKKIKAGDTVTAVVSKKDYNGTSYYTVLAFGDAKQTAAVKK
jgi:hypothetical protein